LRNPKPKYEQPIYWCDIAAEQLRRVWHEHLSRQEIEVKAIRPGRLREAVDRPSQSKPKPEDELLSRAQREHRRLSWWERWERNERKAEDPRWAVVLYSGKTTASRYGARAAGKPIASAMRIISQRSFCAAAKGGSFNTTG
jgi:hypothetical protein